MRTGALCPSRTTKTKYFDQCAKMVDSEDIIRAVKKFRAIWDLEDERYHNKNLKDDAWNGVCLELIPEWETLNEGEKYIRLLELKKKWNNIRDYYKKLLADTRSGEQEVRAKKRRYLYSDILEFIRPVYDKRRLELERENQSNDSNITNDSHNADSDDQDDHDSHLETVTFIGVPTKDKPRKRKSHPLITHQITPAHSSKTTKSKTSGEGNLTVFERSIIKTLEKNVTKNDDSDLLFLKSLLPDMKVLTASQKFDFKIGIMELFRNITNGSKEPHRDHDYDFDRLSEDQVVKVETIRLSEDDSYSSS